MTDLGKVYCWGSGLYGQNGNNDGLILPYPNDNTSGPHLVSSTVFNQLSVGLNHNCALRASDGQAFCWGSNLSGEGGRRTTGDWARVPQAVVNTFKYDKIAAGGAHTIARATTGALVGWGYNAQGQLGIGSTMTMSSPVTILP
jgi:alpha-tubulin suppressor-like RCC1 family protein